MATTDISNITVLSGEGLTIQYNTTGGTYTLLNTGTLYITDAKGRNYKATIGEAGVVTLEPLNTTQTLVQ
jgi:hypothetical protein